MTSPHIQLYPSSTLSRGFLRCFCSVMFFSVHVICGELCHGQKVKFCKLEHISIKSQFSFGALSCTDLARHSAHALHALTKAVVDVYSFGLENQLLYQQNYSQFQSRDYPAKLIPTKPLSMTCIMVNWLLYHRRHQNFLRGVRLKCGESSSAEDARSLGRSIDMFPREIYCCRKLGAYFVKYRNKCLEDKHNSNQIILIGLFLKVKGNFFS